MGEAVPQAPKQRHYISAKLESLRWGLDDQAPFGVGASEDERPEPKRSRYENP